MKKICRGAGDRTRTGQNQRYYGWACAIGGAVVAAFALSACGGSGGDGHSTATSPPAAVAPVIKRPVVIYLDCDSTCWGVDVDDTANAQQAPGAGNGIVGRASPTPTQMLQADADAEFGVGNVLVEDGGAIPGATFMHSLEGLAPDVAPLATRLSALPEQADIVITNMEINDQYVLGEDVSTYASWAQQWIQTVRAVGAIPVYAEPNPVCTSFMNIMGATTGTNALVYAADQTFTAAGGYVLPNLSAWENYTAPPNAQPWNVKYMSSDCVHPNDAGYAFKEANYWPALVPAIRAVMARMQG